jgi:hypothetical protein
MIGEPESINPLCSCVLQSHEPTSKLNAQSQSYSDVRVTVTRLGHPLGRTKIPHTAFYFA